MKERINTLEIELTDVKAQLIELRGTANPGHRPQKELSIEYIVYQVKLGKSARSIAGMLNVRPNTIIARLYKAGYVYYQGKWILADEKTQTKPKTDEEMAEVLKKFNHLL